jgi:glycolate dehydrogenase FAD-binding subunit
MNALEDFAAEIGEEDTVAAVGGMTAWDVGGDVAPGTRLVRAPSGVVRHEPAEMIVRVRAGTTVAELSQVVAEAGQMVPLDPPSPTGATVGGMLAVGRSGLRRLRWGHIRDLVLEVRFVTADGRLTKAGAAVVKNVSGFDLCRPLVGSLGTLGLFAEVVLRTYPEPAESRWLRGEVHPSAPLQALYRPSGVLWDGETTWVLLEGHPGDVDAETRLLGRQFDAATGPPALPGPARVSLRPGELLEVCESLPPASFVAEAGVGVLHASPEASASLEEVGENDAAGCERLHRALKQIMDPAGRLNPGRDPISLHRLRGDRP